MTENILDATGLVGTSSFPPAGFHAEADSADADGTVVRLQGEVDGGMLSFDVPRPMHRRRRRTLAH